MTIRRYEALSILVGWIAALLAATVAAVAMPAKVAEERVLFDGAPACAYNPEFSIDGRWVAYLSALPVPLFEVSIRPLDPSTGSFGPVLPCDESLRVTPFGRPVGWSVDPSGAPYFLYLDAGTQAIRRARVTRDGTGSSSCSVDVFPYGPPPVGEVWRSIAAYTEPGPGGRSFLTYIASDNVHLGMSSWVEIRVVEHDQNGATLSDIVVERQAWSPSCLASPACKFSYGAVLPLDKAYVRWIGGSRPAALLYGSMPTPLAWGAHPEEFPPNLKRADVGLAPRFVSDDGIYPVGVFAYDRGRSLIAGYDDGKDTAVYGLDPATGMYEILAVVPTDPAASQMPDAAHGRAIDFEPFDDELTDGGVFQLIDGTAQYATGLSEIWLLSR